jgi:hypothetical protein
MAGDLLIIETTASQRKRSLRGGVSSWRRFGERREGGQQLSEELEESLGGVSERGEREDVELSECWGGDKVMISFTRTKTNVVVAMKTDGSETYARDKCTRGMVTCL